MFEFWDFFLLFELDFEWFGVDFLIFEVVIGDRCGNLLKVVYDLFLLLNWVFDFLLILLLEGMEVGGMLKGFSGFDWEVIGGGIEFVMMLVKGFIFVVEENGVLFIIGEEYMGGILCILFVVFRGVIGGIFWEVLGLVLNLVLGMFWKGFVVVVDVELGMLLNILLLFVFMIGMFCILFVFDIVIFFFWLLLLNFGRNLLNIGLECLVLGGLECGDWNGFVFFEWFLDVEKFFSRLLLIEVCNVVFFDVGLDLDVLKF